MFNSGRGRRPTVRVKNPLKAAPNTNERQTKSCLTILEGSVAIGTPILSTLPLLCVEAACVVADNIVAASSIPAANVRRNAATMTGIGGGGPGPPPPPMPRPLPIVQPVGSSRSKFVAPGARWKTE